jgi:hypothetical protein
MIVGDKVICINDNNKQGTYSVTIGQIYEVSNISMVKTSLVKDREEKLNQLFGIRVKEKGNSYYPTELFITLEQWREKQLKLIGI